MIGSVAAVLPLVINIKVPRYDPVLANVKAHCSSGSSWTSKRKALWSPIRLTIVDRRTRFDNKNAPTIRRTTAQTRSKNLALNTEKQSARSRLQLCKRQSSGCWSRLREIESPIVVVGGRNRQGRGGFLNWRIRFFFFGVFVGWRVVAKRRFFLAGNRKGVVVTVFRFIDVFPVGNWKCFHDR